MADSLLHNLATETTVPPSTALLYLETGGNTDTKLQLKNLFQGSANAIVPAGSSTGNPVTITATGSDTDINMLLTPKGAGGIGIGNIAPVSKLHAGSVESDFPVGYPIRDFGYFSTVAKTFLAANANLTNNLDATAWVLASANPPTAAINFGLSVYAEQIGATGSSIYAIDVQSITSPALGATYQISAGFFALADNEGAGTVLSQQGFFADSNQNNGGGIVNNSCGFRSESQAGIGNTLNAAFYCVDQGSGANDYAFYSAGGKSVFPDARITKLGNLASNGFVKTSGGDGTLSIDTATYLTTAVTSAIGTANQVTVSGATGAVTFSTPQDIATSSTPQFARLGIGAAADAAILALITGGLVATTTPALKVTATYNNGSNTYQTVLINTTDTASAAASTILDVQQAGTSQFKVQKASVTCGGNIFATAFRATSSGLAFDDTTVYLGTAFKIGAGSSQFGVDTSLLRDGGAGIFAQRSGTTAQTFRVYGTFTDASNYERASLSTQQGASITLAAETAGTGGDNLSIFLVPTGTGRTKSATPLSMISSGGAAVTGNATLVGGTVTVSTTAALTGSSILLTRKTSGGTIGTAITYTISNGTSFTINSDNILDTSTFTWVIVDSY